MRICVDLTEHMMLAYSKYTCADPESIIRGGPTLTIFFKNLMRGEMIQIPLL